MVLRRAQALRLLLCRCALGLTLTLALGALVFAPGLQAQPAPAPAEPAATGGPGLPASIPLKRDTPADSASATAEGWWLAIAAAGILLGFAVVAARRKTRSGGAAGSWWPRLRGASSPHAVERLSSTRLSPRHSVHVVQWEGRRLLLGCSDSTIALLAESKADAPASGEAR